MMNLRFNSKEKDMLIQVTKYFRWKKEFEFEEYFTSFVLKNFDEDDAIDLRELCSDYLLEVGFDEEYNANEEGNLLEELIDKLYVE